jgi:hypothetical protein
VENTGLVIVLERMRRCFWGRTQRNDIDTITLSLQQIFTCLDRLYHLLLPELTICLQTATHREPLAAQSIATQDASQHLYTTYCLWLQLQEIATSLDHLKPLCTLLVSTAPTTIEALDRSCSLYGAASIKQQLLRTGENAERTEVLAAITAAHIPRNTYYHWMQAVSLLTGRLEHWQHCNQQRARFAHDLPLSSGMATASAQVDILFDQMIAHTNRIFGVLLPEFHTIAHGDDETAATLLLDIVQQIDQITLLLDQHSTSLYHLTRAYAYQTALC